MSISCSRPRQRASSLAGLLGQSLGSLRDRDGLSPRQPLPVFEADFQFDPDRERMAAQRLVVERVRELGVDRRRERVAKIVRA